MRTKILTYMAAGALAMTMAAPGHAAVTMSATYFTVTTPDPDFDTNPCCGSYYYNEVQSTLGPDGLPVYNAGYGGPTLYDVNANGELTWWSPSQNSHVTQTGTGTITLPFDDESFFPPDGGGGGDGNGFLAAIFRGVLVVPVAESVQFSFGADDDAFLALDNDVISQLGGIHGTAPAPVTTSVLAPGSYNLTLFYTDRHQTGAGLYFNVVTDDVTVAPPSAPEPASWAMFIGGFGAIGGAMRARRKGVALA